VRRHFPTATMRWCAAHHNREGAWLPLAEFYQGAGGSHHGTWCRTCSRAALKARRASFSIYQCLRISWQAKKSKCARLGIQFGLTFERFVWLISQPCVYGLFGSKPAPVELTAMQIDRVIPALGYVPENCVASCGRHNRLKGDFFTLEDTFKILAEFPQTRACGIVRPAGGKHLPGLRLERSKPPARFVALPLFDSLNEEAS
jgi:hypothetical protein